MARCVDCARPGSQRVSMRSQGRNALISALFVVLGGPGLVLVYVPFWITRFRVPPREPHAQMALAVALILLGLIPLFESIIRFVRVGRGTLVPTAPTQHLVVSGLYGYVRNPMYVGVVASLAGEAILFRNEGLLLFLASAWLATHLFVCFYEEPALTRQHPEEYPLYQRHVLRWLPRVTRWRGIGR
jgi:protein-S-isoprenylcysteine O-methyltransferase Ste14